ncbi:YqjF family protein [Curtobacterium sp. RRHDQ10]|uniref:YqjF family protein n=1 Tax=Curtobacterium phyllosphaerae TaxID=3413379 RepID=UPI003BF1E5C8
MTAPTPITPSAPALPGRAFVTQGWGDVVFLHWRVDVSAVAPLLPAGTRPDTMAADGSDDGTTTWVGLIGFVFRDTAFPPLAPMRRLGTFVEVNVRVYTVDEAGRRGVVFLSLDAGRFLPAVAARTMLALPYHWAQAAVRRDGPSVSYAIRRHGSSLRSRFDVTIGDRIPTPTPVDQFLTARWGMHVRRAGVTRFWPNEHAAWELHRASCDVLHDDLLGAAGLPRSLADVPPDSVLWSPGVQTGFAAGTR